MAGIIATAETEIPGADQAVQQLKGCAERLAEYTDLVFRAIHQT